MGDLQPVIFGAFQRFGHVNEPDINLVFSGRAVDCAVRFVSGLRRRVMVALRPSANAASSSLKCANYPSLYIILLVVIEVWTAAFPTPFEERLRGCIEVGHASKEMSREIRVRRHTWIRAPP